SSFFATGIVLVSVLLANQARGYRGWAVLPAGYQGALLGAAIFLLGGAADMGWHTFFGFERSMDALMSPTHLILAGGIGLIVSGPLRAAWRRPAGERGWAALLPVLLSLG